MRVLKQFMIVILVLVIATGLTAGDGNKNIPALDKKNMDLSVKPGDDFFRYANGNWIKNVVIPGDKARYTAFEILTEETLAQVQALLDETAKRKDVAPGSAAQKIRDYYGMGMDTAKIEEQGLTPLKSEFERIEKITDLTGVQDMIAYMHTYGIDPLFEGTVFQDLKNSKIYKFYLMNGGIGLSDVEYYYKDDDRSEEIRSEYVKHVAKMFELMGDKPELAAGNAKTVMVIETRLAKKSFTRLQMRNLPALYNKKSLQQVMELAPSFDWKRYFKNISDKDFGDLIVGMPEFFKEVELLLKEVPIKDWKTYLRWHLINKYAPHLSKAFVDQNFKFKTAFLSGNKEISPRWKRMSRSTNRALGELVGKLYVEKYFPPESKKRMNELVANLKKSLKKRIENLQWMGPETKKAALKKLETMRAKIGYPDKWRDYSKLDIKRDAHVLNVMRANRFNYYDRLDKFGKPVDPDRWFMTPQTVNAGYMPMNNEILFPAGILQPPLFNADADNAVNYGAIGMVIGHEMTHGFDDQGRRFDKDGNMTDWWTKEDEVQFKKRTQLLVDQYSKFVAVGDVKVDGELSLGENIADFGGLTVALQAYKMSLEGKKAPAPIDGLTDVQRFFLAYAQVWRGKIREKALIRMVKEDVHPWAEYRVNGALFNVPEFYEAFDIKATDKLYRSNEQRPVIW